MENKRLEKASKKENKMLTGVCYGLAKRFDQDPSIIRIIFAVLFFGAGIGLLPYIILFFVMPESSEF